MSWLEFCEQGLHGMKNKQHEKYAEASRKGGGGGGKKEDIKERISFNILYTMAYILIYWPNISYSLFYPPRSFNFSSSVMSSVTTFFIMHGCCYLIRWIIARGFSFSSFLIVYLVNRFSFKFAISHDS